MTRFMCRRCCARTARRRNAADCRAFVRANNRRAEFAAAAKARLVLRISNGEVETGSERPDGRAPDERFESAANATLASGDVHRVSTGTTPVQAPLEGFALRGRQTQP